jgi:hypothetical protein
MIDVSVKDVADLITGLGAVIAAIQSWRAHGESKQARVMLAEIKAEIKAKQTTNVTVINSPTTQTVGAGAAAPLPPGDT